jgi:hypothetical protein
MESFASVDPSALRWLRTAEAPGTFELRSGDQLIARLTLGRHGGSLAHAETASAKWSLKRVGFLHPRVTVRNAEGAGDVARLDIHWRRTSLQLAGGRSYTFERAGLSVPAWQFTSSSGEKLVHVEPVREGRHLEGGTVSVAPGGVGLPELPILLVTGWYYIVQEWFEDEAVAATEAVLDATS